MTTDTQSLTLSDEEIGMIYAELAVLQIDLDEDPLLYGPKRLNSKIAQTRTMLTRCEQIFLELSRRLHGCQREHRKQNALLEMQKQDLLANDPEVRAGRNIADRDAIAAIKLRPQIEKSQKLETATTDLDTVLAVVKVKRADIKDIQNRLKDQIKVCQDEIGLGARWGSASPSNVILVPGQNTTFQPKVGTSDQMDALLGEIDRELDTGFLPDPPKEILIDLDDKPSSQKTVEQETTPPAPPVGEILVATASQEKTDDALDALDLDSGSESDDFDLLLG